MSWNSKLVVLLHLLLVFVETSFTQGCDTSGINCISCTEYRTCIAGSPQGKVVSCKNGGSCADDSLKQCQMKLNCYALNECVQNGIFPDATNESRYFVCLSDGSTGFLKYEFSCPDGQFFDQSMNCVPKDITAADPYTPVSSTTISTTSPDASSTTASTTSPDASSTTASTTSPDASSTTASTTSPDASTTTASTTSPDASSTTASTTSSDASSTTASTTSPDASSTTAFTTSPDASSTTASTTSPDASTTSPDTSTTTTPNTPTPIPPFVCPEPGIFPNPDNCKIYYRCSTSLKPFYYICPGRSYFNENILKCSLKISPACQEQILKNSTSTTPLKTIATTSKPTTTTSTTTTTTPKTTITTTTAATATTTIITTTASTTTTNQSPTATTPFSCPMAGTFENPVDCKTYYRCSTSGKVFRYICPGASYFNEITKRCSLAATARCRKLIQG